ncbi:MAG: 4Fe-4S dicluster domain-containing protein [Deltaproteobacteria bacterium]
MKEVFVRLDRCTGCLSCQLACAVEHSASKNLFAAVAETPKPRYRLFVERARESIVPLTCRHCDPAPCLDACIAGALSRDERGAVVLDYDRCIGCWTCLMVCPYGVVGRKKEEKIAVKCDRCPDRDEPACVGACPTKALLFAEPDDFGAGMRALAAGVVAKAAGG